MESLQPLDQIDVPEPAADDTFRITLLERDFAFEGLKCLLGAADISKSGDRVTGLAAADDVTREAARRLLSTLTLQYLYEHPLTDARGRVDDVMRVNYAIDRERFDAIAAMTLGDFKNHLLRTTAAELEGIGAALTGVMAAAVAKLMDVHELILVAKKLRRSTKARTRIGVPGTLSSRLQPNHPTDDPDGVTMLVYTGLSMGAGDCLIGLNPARDTRENVGAMLRLLDRLRTRTGAPSQICVLSHIKTQLACLRDGAPVEILFQSIAGTQSTLSEEFDVTVALLDEAHDTMREHGPLRDVAEHQLYFETGQGSEMTYGKHDGIDMSTCEALCYGLARRYRPFMVNNVTGFIGPETHVDNMEMILANLQDHFMGKLLGLPMGMAPCYTLHSRTDIEGHQVATQLLTAAGANYFMDVYLSVDRMLAYFDTSGHDDQTLREVHGLEPTAEYLDWALDRGIFERGEEGTVVRGPNWGNPRIFCESDEELAELARALPTSYGLENAGPRPADSISREFRANLAVAREAIHADLDVKDAVGIELREWATRAADRDAHLNDPELGAHLAGSVLETLSVEDDTVQIIISDGLSAEAIHHNVPELLPVLLDGLDGSGISVGRPILARYGRVKLVESVGDALRPEVLVNLIGERPGGDARSSKSMSAYLAYRLGDEDTRSEAARFSGNPKIRYEYSVISNIYTTGLPPVEAASVIVERIREMLEHKAGGNRLAKLLGEKIEAA